MNDKDNPVSDRLMIVESGRRARRGATALLSPTGFHREIVGRHVIYKSPDGSKLRSMAEARRYFKQKGQAWDESQFDFTPPDIGAKKTPPPATPSKVTVPSKGHRGRPQLHDGASPSKKSPKLGTAPEKELTDDVNAIRDSLAKESGARKTAVQVAASSAPVPKRRRGRPPKQLNESVDVASSSELNVSLCNTNGGATTGEADANSSLADSAANKAGPVDEAQSLGSDFAAAGEQTHRPTRQRRPNQRYTDLISEKEVRRKRMRKDGDGSATSGSATPTSIFKRSLHEMPTPLPKISAAATTASSLERAGPMEFMQREREPKAAKRRAAVGRNRRIVLQKRRPAVVQQLPSEEEDTASSSESDVLSDRELSLSPSAPREFEAPPEFVEIQETPSTPQEDQLPPVLPAVQSSVLPAVQSSVLPAAVLRYNEVDDASITAPEHPAPKPVDTPIGQLATEAPSTEPLLKDFDSAAGSSRYDDTFMPRDIIMDVKRGRKPSNRAPTGLLLKQPTTSARAGVPIFGSYRDESSRFKPQYGLSNKLDRLSSGRSFGMKSIDASQCSTWASSAQLQEPNVETPVEKPVIRGLARLQNKDLRKITIGRYGATSVAVTASMKASMDGPPELEEFGLRTPGVMAKKPMQLQQRGIRQQESPDPSLFCRLPPEVSSDHCYGRQPSSTAPKGDDHLKVGRRANTMGQKYRNGHPFGSPPMLEPADAYPRHPQRRSHYPQERASHHFRTPSPPPYESPSHNYEAAPRTYESVDVAGLSGGLRGADSVSSVRSHLSAMLSDKLPANILEEDDGETNNDYVSVDI